MSVKVKHVEVDGVRYSVRVLPPCGEPGVVVCVKGGDAVRDVDLLWRVVRAAVRAEDAEARELGEDRVFDLGQLSNLTGADEVVVVRNGCLTESWPIVLAERRDGKMILTIANSPRRTRPAGYVASGTRQGSEPYETHETAVKASAWLEASGWLEREAGRETTKAEPSVLAGLRADLAFKEAESAGWGREYVRGRYRVREFAWYWTWLAAGSLPHVVEQHVAAGWEALPAEPPLPPGSWSYRAVAVYSVRRLREGFEDREEPKTAATVGGHEADATLDEAFKRLSDACGLTFADMDAALRKAARADSGPFAGEARPFAGPTAGEKLDELRDEMARLTAEASASLPDGFSRLAADILSGEREGFEDATQAERVAAVVELAVQVREFGESVAAADADPDAAFAAMREAVEKLRRDVEAEELREMDARLREAEREDDAEVAAILAAPTSEAAWTLAVDAGRALARRVNPSVARRLLAHLSREVEAEEPRVAAELLVRLAVAEVATSDRPFAGPMDHVDETLIREKLEKARTVAASRHAPTPGPSRRLFVGVDPAIGDGSSETVVLVCERGDDGVIRILDVVSDPEALAARVREFGRLRVVDNSVEGVDPSYRSPRRPLRPGYDHDAARYMPLIFDDVDSPSRYVDDGVQPVITWGCDLYELAARVREALA